MTLDHDLSCFAMRLTCGFEFFVDKCWWPMPSGTS
eukprot:CAMPEP_0117577802 /NCGR_PEP_ID=MMETSP0784-20121206/63626_1 /TAXON_ID=39447 /ORGANISM="" /LENGTH=34 /DNA_ID= /DNA_START= /DNA_END= /DNA_ORIENTATION=